MEYKIVVQEKTTGKTLVEVSFDNEKTGEVSRANSELLNYEVYISNKSYTDIITKNFISHMFLIDRKELFSYPMRERKTHTVCR